MACCSATVPRGFQHCMFHSGLSCLGPLGGRCCQQQRCTGCKFSALCTYIIPTAPYAISNIHTVSPRHRKVQCYLKTCIDICDIYLHPLFCTAPDCHCCRVPQFPSPSHTAGRLLSQQEVVQAAATLDQALPRSDGRGRRMPLAMRLIRHCGSRGVPLSVIILLGGFFCL